MQYMVIENIGDRDPAAVHQSFRERAMTSEQLQYGGSWIVEALGRCYHVVDCVDRQQLDEWLSSWRDLSELEVNPILPDDVH